MYYIAKYDTFNNGYNLTIGGGGKRLIDVYNKYEEIVDLYKSGFSSNWIAEKFDVDKSTIVKLLKSLNIKLRDNKFKINRFELESLIEDYKNGYSLKSIAKRYDVTPETIKQKLINEGVDLRDNYCLLNRDLNRQEELVNDYVNGISASEIIKKYHCEWTTFHKILKKHGLTYNNKRDCKKIYKLDDKQCLKAMEMYKQGYKVSEISKMFHVDRTTIYNMFKRFQFNYKTI